MPKCARVCRAWAHGACRSVFQSIPLPTEIYPLLVEEREGPNPKDWEGEVVATIRPIKHLTLPRLWRGHPLLNEERGKMGSVGFPLLVEEREGPNPKDWEGEVVATVRSSTPHPPAPLARVPPSPQRGEGKIHRLSDAGRCAGVGGSGKVRHV